MAFFGNPDPPNSTPPLDFPFSEDFFSETSGLADTNHGQGRRDSDIPGDELPQYLGVIGPT
ncbi:hypothetical protein N7520_011267 [Penicillium odoratum]|uniref:uncharacterized protein n=1 Tax=Penicillium odoratum TaxID=1167516 RepID=UPI0025469639|nr:uncharacterized protein N7520_011267 [Penicillium odoratum]KAJ5746085.1 hypothetical protein N7520_011267 [Penicillium odoratum]